MHTSRENNQSRARRMVAPMLILTFFLSGIAPALASGADVNAGASAGTLINAATAPIDTPAGREAVGQATNIAKSPEMQGAVKSFWQTTWDATWPFVSGMVVKFFGLFVIAWQVIARMPSEINANANVNANVNAAAPTNVNAPPSAH